MVYTIIAAMASLHIGVCLLSYCKALHGRLWYFPVGLGLALLNNLFGFVAAKMAHDPQDFYFLSSLAFIGIPTAFLVPPALEQAKEQQFHLIAIGFIFVGLVLLFPV